MVEDGEAAQSLRSVIGCQSQNMLFASHQAVGAGPFLKWMSSTPLSPARPQTDGRMQQREARRGKSPMVNRAEVRPICDVCFSSAPRRRGGGSRGGSAGQPRGGQMHAGRGEGVIDSTPLNRAMTNVCLARLPIGAARGLRQLATVLPIGCRPTRWPSVQCNVPYTRLLGTYSGWASNADPLPYRVQYLAAGTL